MARYILIHKQHGVIQGLPMEQGGQRPFISLAEAFETVANFSLTESDESWGDFHAWQVLELHSVEN